VSRTAAPPPLPRKSARESTPLSDENGTAVRRQVVDWLRGAARELAELRIDALTLLDRLGTSVLLRLLKTEPCRMSPRIPRTAAADEER
jgi:hypothetical protein